MDQLRYYTDGLASTWRKPADFVHLVRHFDDRRVPGYKDWAAQTRRAKRPVHGGGGRAYRPGNGRP